MEQKKENKTNKPANTPKNEEIKQAIEAKKKLIASNKIITK